MAWTIFSRLSDHEVNVNVNLLTMPYTDRAQYWQPISLSTYFLVGIITLSALLILAIQLLLERSLAKGALIHAANINELTLRQSFPLLYLPTVIAVIYAFLWTWIDLDVKRLEPFHQLSNGTAVQAKTSLLLQYPVEFVAAVPIKAFRLKSVLRCDFSVVN